MTNEKKNDARKNTKEIQRKSEMNTMMTLRVCERRQRQRER